MSSITRNYLKNSNGISGAEHACFCSYLIQQKAVQCNGVNSNEKIVTDGVLHGSILGPTLFCKHITGMESTTPVSSVLLYADDTETHHLSPTLQTAILKINSNLQNIST